MSRQHRSVLYTLVVLVATLGFAAPAVAEKHTVTLPVGSVDGLAAAIASAGPGGTVVVESGLHQESGTVIVDIPVAIVGEPGAIIEGSTVPNLDDGSPDDIDPVLHILETQDVLVEGLAIQPPSGSTGNTAILIQGSPRTTIRENVISDHEFGVIVQGGDHAEITGNTIQDMLLFGVVNINGGHVRIIGNEIVSVGIYGVWLCDLDGQYQFNSTSECLLGVMLCRFPDGAFVLPDGSANGAASAATGWHVSNNESHDNELFGYLATDGANNNVLANNGASKNGVVDILLDSEFDDGTSYAPPSFENVVARGSHKNVAVWDFGVDNVVSGDAVP